MVGISEEETRKMPPETQGDTLLTKVCPWIKQPTFRNGRTVRIGLLDRNQVSQHSYKAWIEQFGELVIVRPTEGYRADIDILVLPGGPDLEPGDYYVGNSSLHNKSTPEWSIFMQKALPQYLINKTKIFGICLGFQMLTVALGGKLYPHIPGHNGLDHYVGVTDKWALKLGVDEKVQRVNSRHHQTIAAYPKYLLPVAWSLLGKKEDLVSHTPADYGLLEAWIHSYAPVMGVQWHAEDILHKPESYYTRKYGYCIGDIIANAMFEHLIQI